MKKTELENLTALAGRGSAEAQNYLGVYYATDGNDNKQALKWYLKSACSGYAEALWNAGSMLLDGEDGIEKDAGLGLLLVRLAADAFQSSACLYLSRCYELGRLGIPMESELACFWHRMAYSSDRFMIRSNSVELSLLMRNLVVRKYIDLPPL
ncbi:sel1 repeat family protein [Acidovorax sp. YS12]|nr:sel1 repeat family protein [Acidovorax sp. YS12]